jgi:hypothetical protein
LSVPTVREERWTEDFDTSDEAGQCQVIIRDRVETRLMTTRLKKKKMRDG